MNGDPNSVKEALSSTQTWVGVVKYTAYNLPFAIVLMWVLYSAAIEREALRMHELKLLNWCTSPNAQAYFDRNEMGPLWFPDHHDSHNGDPNG